MSSLSNEQTWQDISFCHLEVEGNSSHLSRVIKIKAWMCVCVSFPLSPSHVVCGSAWLISCHCHVFAVCCKWKLRQVPPFFDDLFSKQAKIYTDGCESIQDRTEDVFSCFTVTLTNIRYPCGQKNRLYFIFIHTHTHSHFTTDLPFSVGVCLFQRTSGVWHGQHGLSWGFIPQRAFKKSYILGPWRRWGCHRILEDKRMTL